MADPNPAPLLNGFSDALPLLLAGLGVLVALDCASRIASRPRPHALLWALGASLSFAILGWALHILRTGALNPSLVIGYHPVLLMAALALGIMGSLPAWWLLFADPGSRKRILAGAALLSLTFLAAQSIALLAPGFVPGLAWSWSGMALAWAVLTLLTLAAVAALHWQTDRAPLPWARRLVATLLLGLGLWWIQHQITAQSAIEAQTGASYAEMIPIGALYLMASLGSLVVLFMVMLISVVESRMQSSLLQVQGTLDKHHLTDPLTQLPNRQCVEDQLPQLTLQADERHQNVSVLFLDLDGFKPINESFGHRFGDLLLQAVARRLVDQIGTQALVARWAADEFVVLADRHDTQEAVAALARQLLDALKQPIEIEGRDIPVAASIGIEVYPRDGAQSMLVAHADAAARSAKGSGGDTYCFFEPHMLQDIREQMELLKDLKLALEQSQLELYYQPKVHAPSGQITGAEGLLRWNHPVRGLISPNMFIPIAERFGLIGAMGNWVIDEACRQIREWRDGGLRMRVAINLSVHQMRQPGLAERIASALEAHGINPRLLTCEITESVAMEDTDSTKKLFASLAAVGVHLSIDDFGTGYSSLSYLRQLPAEELKIDRSFVVDIEQSEDARAVVDAVIKLGLALDLKVVAEGVETDGQYQVLRQLGCDELQGFLFARPMTAKMLYLWATIEKGADNIDFRPSLFADTQMHPLDAEPTRSP